MPDLVVGAFVYEIAVRGVGANVGFDSFVLVSSESVKEDQPGVPRGAGCLPHFGHSVLFALRDLFGAEHLPTNVTADSCRGCGVPYMFGQGQCQRSVMSVQRGEHASAGCGERHVER